MNLIVSVFLADPSGSRVVNASIEGTTVGSTRRELLRNAKREHEEFLSHTSSEQKGFVLSHLYSPLIQRNIWTQEMGWNDKAMKQLRQTARQKGADLIPGEPHIPSLRHGDPDVPRIVGHFIVYIFGGGGEATSAESLLWDLYQEKKVCGKEVTREGYPSVEWEGSAKAYLVVNGKRKRGATQGEILFDQWVDKIS